MKYIDADKLIAEIERLMGLLPKEQGVSINLDWERNTLVALHQFIISLQQEQSSFPSNLDEAAKEALPCPMGSLTSEEMPTPEPGYSFYQMVKMFKAGAEWMASRVQSEGDLEKEIMQYQREDMDRDTTVKDVARHFYELGRNTRKPIWHNVAEETPTKYGEEVIVAFRNKNKEDGIWLYDLIQCWEGKWEPRVNWETPVKWAYVKDLDNAKKEE